MIRTAVYHAGALGDFITILPFLNALRTANPKCSISLLSRQSHMELADLCGLVDEKYDIGSSSLSSLFSSTHSQESKSFLTTFDRVFCMAARNNPVIEAFESAHVQTYTQPPFPTDDTHIIDYHLGLLKLVPIPIIRADYRLPTAGKAGEKNVFFHPGSGSPRKNWAAAKYETLAATLRSDGYEINWLCGPAEDQFQSSEDRVYRNCRIPDLAMLLGTGVLYVGNDSGISHLSAITGTPTIVLFGASNPRIWAPRGPNVHVVKAAQDVCRPCHPAPRPSTCSCICMDTITVEDVYEECRKRLD